MALSESNSRLVVGKEAGCMGKHGKKKRVGLGSVTSACHPLERIRRQWLGKAVWFDAGRGDGRQLGRVTAIGEWGDVVVEAAPFGHGRVSGIAFSLGFVDWKIERVL